MGKVAWDLECRNPECENPTRLDDVRAETKPDGTVVIEGADGADVNAVCESCHGRLSKVLGNVNIGGGRPERLEPPGSSHSFDEAFFRISGFKKLHSSGVVVLFLKIPIRVYTTKGTLRPCLLVKWELLIVSKSIKRLLAAKINFPPLGLLTARLRVLFLKPFDGRDRISFLFSFF